MKKLLLILVTVLTYTLASAQQSKENKYLAVSYYGYYNGNYVINVSNFTDTQLTILIEWDGGSMIDYIAQYQLAFSLPAIYRSHSNIKVTVVDPVKNSVLTIKIP